MNETAARGKSHDLFFCVKMCLDFSDNIIFLQVLGNERHGTEGTDTNVEILFFT